MIRKNKPSMLGIYYPVNTSPSKRAPKYPRESPVLDKTALSPAKLYQKANDPEIRPAKYIYRDQNALQAINDNDPAKYRLRTEYTQASQRCKLGFKPDQLSELARQKSAKRLDQCERIISSYKNARQTVRDKSPAKNKSIDPANKFYIESEWINENSCKQDRTKEDWNNQARNKGRSSKQERSRGRSALKNADQNKAKKSAYRLKYEYSNAYLLDNRSSYSQFLKHKQKAKSPLRQKLDSFELEEKWKEELSFRNNAPNNKTTHFGQFQNFY